MTDIFIYNRINSTKDFSSGKIKDNYTIYYLKCVRQNIYQFLSKHRFSKFNFDLNVIKNVAIILNKHLLFTPVKNDYCIMDNKRFLIDEIITSEYETVLFLKASDESNRFVSKDLNSMITLGLLVNEYPGVVLDELLIKLKYTLLNLDTFPATFNIIPCIGTVPLYSLTSLTTSTYTLYKEIGMYGGIQDGTLNTGINLKNYVKNNLTLVFFCNEFTDTIFTCGSLYSMTTSLLKLNDVEISLTGIETGCLIINLGTTIDIYYNGTLLSSTSNTITGTLPDSNLVIDCSSVLETFCISTLLSSAQTTIMNSLLTTYNSKLGRL